MLAFRPPAFAPIRPSLQGALLAQEAPPIVTPGQIKAIGTGFGLASATLGAAAAWVGFSTGSKESGLLSIAGYVIGAVGALTGLFSLIGVARLVAVDTAEVQKMINEAAQKARAEQQQQAPAQRTAFGT